MNDEEVILTLQYRIDPTKIHLKVSDNITGCMATGDATINTVWGEYLTTISKFVGCLKCIELMRS